MRYSFVVVYRSYTHFFLGIFSHFFFPDPQAHQLEKIASFLQEVIVILPCSPLYYTINICLSIYTKLHMHASMHASSFFSSSVHLKCMGKNKARYAQTIIEEKHSQTNKQEFTALQSETVPVFQFPIS